MESVNIWIILSAKMLICKTLCILIDLDKKSEASLHFHVVILITVETEIIDLFFFLFSLLLWLIFTHRIWIFPGVLRNINGNQRTNRREANRNYNRRCKIFTTLIFSSINSSHANNILYHLFDIPLYFLQQLLTIQMLHAWEGRILIILHNY